MIADRSGPDWVAHWRAMSDDELLDERFRLFDFAEIVDRGSPEHEFVRAALQAIAAIRLPWTIDKIPSLAAGY